jgi:hypothetical protein
MENPPQSPDLRIGGDAFDRTCKLGRFRSAGGDGANHRCAQARDELRLGCLIVLRDIHLHMQRRFDAERFGLGAIVLEVKLLVQRRHVAKPRIAQLILIDQMEMGIDDRNHL